MPPIQVVNYVPPDGRRENITVDLDPQTYLLAEKLLADGFVIERDYLAMVAQVSWTIGNDEQGDVAFNIVDELTDATEAVTKLIRDFVV